jgi:hypothetical protein
MVNDTTYFLAEENFGLCLGSPEGYFYTRLGETRMEKTML